MLQHVIESQHLDPTQILRSMARSTAIHANVPSLGLNAIQPLVDEAIVQLTNGNTIKALMALAAIVFQQAYHTNDITLADHAFRVWSRLLGVEPDAIIEAIATAMHNQEEP